MAPMQHAAPTHVTDRARAQEWPGEKELIKNQTDRTSPPRAFPYVACELGDVVRMWVAAAGGGRELDAGWHGKRSDRSDDG